MPLRTAEKITVEGEVRADHLDMRREDAIKTLTQDYRSDPTRPVQGQRQLRRRTVQDYRQLLDDDEGTKRSIEDMLAEASMADPETKKQLEQQYFMAQTKKVRKRKMYQNDIEAVVYTKEQQIVEETAAIQAKAGTEGQQDAEDEADYDDAYDGADPDDMLTQPVAMKKRQIKVGQKNAMDKINENEGDNLNEDDFAMMDQSAQADSVVFIDNLPKDEKNLRAMLKQVNKSIAKLEEDFFREEDSDNEYELQREMANPNMTPAMHNVKLAQFKEKQHIQAFWSIPMSDCVKEVDWDALIAQQKRLTNGRLFDVITADPPWQLASANPTRGVAIAYEQLSDSIIKDIPLDKLQTDGFILLWVINAKYRFAIEFMEHYNYTLVDEIAWVKQTVNGKIAKGHGFYLQHAKETCLVGVKGKAKDIPLNTMADVIFSQRRGQSQKPEEIYEIAEALSPNGYFLELFGRRNNLHDGWVTVGNEL